MRAALALALAFTVPSLALADPAPTEVVAAADALTGAVDQAVREDASMDHGMILPTAQTQPAHTLSINDYEIAILGLSYGVTDRIQLSVTAMPAPFIGGVVVGTVKWQALRVGPLRGSVQGGMGTTGPHVGAAVSHCLGADCHSLLSANVTFLPAMTGDDRTPFVYGASWIQRFGTEVKFVLEAASGGSVGTGEIGFQHFEGAFVAGGLRFFGPHFAMDLGVVKGLGSAFDAPAILPFVSASARF